MKIMVNGVECFMAINLIMMWKYLFDDCIWKGTLCLLTESMTYGQSRTRRIFRGIDLEMDGTNSTAL